MDCTVGGCWVTLSDAGEWVHTIRRHVIGTGNGSRLLGPTVSVLIWDPDLAFDLVLFWTEQYLVRSQNTNQLFSAQGNAYAPSSWPALQCEGLPTRTPCSPLCIGVSHPLPSCCWLFPMWKLSSWPTGAHVGSPLRSNRVSSPAPHLRCY